MELGYSTGAVAFGDYQLALERLRPHRLTAIELSALRLAELGPLVNAIPDLDLVQYSYLAFHAPSRYSSEQEPNVVDEIRRIADRFDAIVVHPDAVQNRRLWNDFGELICFENMDKRKPIGRTADELSTLFNSFPNASLCLDLGHAWQIDRTMTEARQILRRFKGRVRQVHVSEVNTNSEHVPLTLTTVTAFRRVMDLLPDVPWILEAVTPAEKIGSEISFVRESFATDVHLAIPD